MEFAGVIAAAGLSSRMKEFKPLLELNGFPMIRMTVQSMRNAGIRRITVVTGYRGREIAEALEGTGVTFRENPEYACTDMLASVKLGLLNQEADAVFVLPGDMPLTSPDTFRRLQEKAGGNETENIDYLIPVLKGIEAHPPLLFQKGIRKVLSFGGQGGLRGALASGCLEQVEISDEGALADADFQAEFAGLMAYARAKKGLSEKECKKLFLEADVPSHIWEHCRAVGELAGHMAQTLADHGAFLDVELARSGGFLHDLMRLRSSHEKEAGSFLRERGYLALAEVAERHGGFEREPAGICEEGAIVCLADKLIRETKRVSLEERYQKALSHKEVKERILRDMQICRRLKEEYEVMTGEQL